MISAIVDTFNYTFYLILVKVIIVLFMYSESQNLIGPFAGENS